MNKPSGRAPFAVKLMTPESTDEVLNVGCFDGALEYFFLKDKVKSFKGIDVNEDAVKVANQWSKQATGQDCFQIAYSEKMPFADQSFSKVLCLDTFEHVNDEIKTAEEIYRVLKPGGTLILSVPHHFLNFLDHDELTKGLRNFVRKYIRKKPLLNHPLHRHYSEQDLRRFFHKFEFEVVHKSSTFVWWFIALFNTALGLPQKLINMFSFITRPLEDLDYAIALPTGFNIMIRVKKKN